MPTPTPPPPRKLGLAVLGLGEGRSIISAGVQSPLWDVVWLCDLNEALGRQRCAEFGLTQFTSSFEQVLADPRVDAVGIYTPDHLHATHVIQALNAGKHVICTKPFLNDLTQARDVLAAQQRSGRQVMVGQSSRFFAPFARQREHFLSGAFGELITIEAQYHADHRWFLEKPWARSASFKWLFGGLSHPADFIRWYLPDVTEVMGYADLSPTGRAGGLVNPDTFHFIFKSAAGRIARVSGTYSSPTVPAQRDSGMSCILRCTGGASQADYHELRYAWKIGSQAVVEAFEGAEDYYFRFEGHRHHAGEYQNYIEYFARGIAAGETPKPDAREGIVTVALLQAMEESTTRGQPVQVRAILDRHGLGDLA
ncbi:Gfo/Idh/MocA family oxidoreductase [Opitutus sp. ER46]|uniref:Gfo/Idh/MocA family protein n=1 Tax=Opitutus sp. ER46 TaxID=2161864 RepID=UPI000D328197|nr:Gfo/Idh/MocA family oxidoreductase [Opitutus sp. ER46]PTY00128.1 oxidoreductase [Opitutus sp. ER46]